MLNYCWLASYPKSGNTWFRMIDEALRLAPQGKLRINNLSGLGIASERLPVENATLIRSGLLTHEEIERLRSKAYNWFVKKAAEASPVKPAPDSFFFVKVHDAWTVNNDGEALLGGPTKAVLITRDPRDIAPSLAHHRGWTLDKTIDFMAASDAILGRNTDWLQEQFPQRLLSWSGHTASWLDQAGLDLHHFRYEDLHSKPVSTLAAVYRFIGLPQSTAEIRRAVDQSAFSALRDQEDESGFVEATARGSFFRRGKVGSWREELSAQQTARIEGIHGKMMERLGYL